MVCGELVTSSVENTETEVVTCVGFAAGGRIDIGDSVAPAPICLRMIQNHFQIIPASIFESGTRG